MRRFRGFLLVRATHIIDYPSIYLPRPKVQSESDFALILISDMHSMYLLTDKHHVLS
jgi:hypothetical protein